MDIELLEIPTIKDYRGNIAVIEKDVLPYKVNRVYYLFDVPSSATRGGHAHKAQIEFLIPLSGSFDVILKNGQTKKTISLNKPNKGLLIPINTWRELENFSSGAVCLVLSSGVFDEDDYIRDFQVYLDYINNLKS